MLTLLYTFKDGSQATCIVKDTIQLGCLQENANAVSVEIVNYNPNPSIFVQANG
jgi:hypothetical protein